MAIEILVVSDHSEQNRSLLKLLHCAIGQLFVLLCHAIVRNHGLFKYGGTQFLFSDCLIVYEEIIKAIYISPLPRIVVPRLAY